MFLDRHADSLEAPDHVRGKTGFPGDSGCASLSKHIENAKSLCLCTCPALFCLYLWRGEDLADFVCVRLEWIGHCFVVWIGASLSSVRSAVESQTHRCTWNFFFSEPRIYPNHSKLSEFTTNTKTHNNDSRRIRILVHFSRLHLPRVLSQVPERMQHVLLHELRRQSAGQV